MSINSRVFIIFSMVLLLVSSALGDRIGQKKNVLFLHSYHQGYKWTDDETQGALVGLASVKGDLILHIEYMDTKMAFGEPYLHQLRNLYKYFKYKFHKIRFDLIMAMDDDAFNFLKRYRDEIFPNTSIVFCGINWFNPASVPVGFKGYTGVNEDADIPATLDLMLRLHPGTKNVYVIIDTTTSGKKIHAQFNGILPNYKDKASFIFLENMDLSEILGTVGKLGKDSLVLLTIFQKEKSGRFFEFSESANLISTSSRVPVYGLWDFNLGFGIVGGMLTSAYYQGKTAGEMAVRILQGVKADAIPVLMKSPNQFMFDYRQLQRWNIRHSDLPSDSIVINEPAAFYDLHKGLVWGVVSGFLSLTIIIVLLLINTRQHRKAEELLRESETRLSEIINFLPDATFAIDLDGKIIVWNRAAEEYTGVKAMYMLGKGDQEYSIPFHGVKRLLLINLVEQPVEEIEKLFSYVKKEGAKISGEGYIKSAKRGEAFMLGIAAPLYNFKGSVVGAIESIRDITDRKKVEAELENYRVHLENLVKEKTKELEIARDEAEAANRTKSAFLASMSHELRTPLNSIIGFTGILLQELAGPLNPEQHKQLTMVQNSSRHLLALISDVLDISKIEAGHLVLTSTSFNIKGSIEKMVKLVLPLAEKKGINLQLILPDNTDTMMITTDQRRLEQVVLNLLSNAVKFSEKGKIEIICQANNDHYILSFSDTGIGIEPDNLPNLFKPFHQLDTGLARKQEGTGLGLSICKKIVDLMGGSIEVESKLGQGSIFTVRLPRQRGNAA